jgi:hypothetical protein
MAFNVAGPSESAALADVIDPLTLGARRVNSGIVAVSSFQ